MTARRLIRHALLLSALLSSPWPALANLHDICQHAQTLPDTASITQQLDHSLRQYQPLVEQAVAYRQQSLRVAGRLQAHLDSGKPLTGQQLDELNHGTRAHLDLRESLYAIAFQYECWLDDGFIGANHIDDRQRLKGVMISLSAALVLYDNYRLAISLFQDNQKLRRTINASDTGFDIRENKLKQISRTYYDPNYRQRVQAAIRFYQARIPRFRAALQQDEDFTYLYELIEQSPSYHSTFHGEQGTRLINKAGFLLDAAEDDLLKFRDEAVNLLSGLFGNTVGLVEVRHGKLYDNVDVAEHVGGNLRAGDILLEKTPFRLTDKLIPGHWGHVAIWAGTERELRELGLWRHELVRPWQKQIRQGHGVIEALRTGVEINPLGQFLNIDDLAVIRVNHMDQQQRRETLLRAFRQIGKAYDFNFDVETTDRIVCSELVYVVYTDLGWPTENTLGRFTISPDHIANKALSDEALQLVTLYHDGRPVWRRPAHRLQQLMQLASDS